MINLRCVEMISLMKCFELTRPIFNYLDLFLGNVVIVGSQESLKINLPFFIQIKDFEQTAYLFL
jgi:hypothetical protein